MGRISLRLVVLGVVLAGQGSCEWSGSESITVTAEEFRFTPAQIQVRPYYPFTLILRNQGRERHVFQSPELIGEQSPYAESAASLRVQPGGSIILESGESIEMRLVLGPGLYPFRCLLKGHAGMEGAIVALDE